MTTLLIQHKLVHPFMCTSYKIFFKDREYLLTFLTLMSVMLLSLKRHLCWSFVIGFYSQCMCWNGVFVTICTCTACPIRTKKIQPTLHTKRKLIWSCIKNQSGQRPIYVTFLVINRMVWIWFHLWRGDSSETTFDFFCTALLFSKNGKRERRAAK